MIGSKVERIVTCIFDRIRIETRGSDHRLDTSDDVGNPSRTCYARRVSRVRSTFSIASLAVVASLFSIVASIDGCKPAVATPAECDAVAKHLAELQLKKEKTPPFGRLLPPFDDADHEKEIFDEAYGNAKTRCGKGWKRDVFECMTKAADLETADKCRFL
jgi:hypothetical protein